MWNIRLGESQAGIKISGRNISNLKYADNTTLMAENEESEDGRKWRASLKGWKKRVEKLA